MPVNNLFKSNFFGSRYHKSRYYQPASTVEDTPEGGPNDGDYLLQEEDEVIMLIARAFLTMVN